MSICINCLKNPSIKDEFCDICNEELNEMVDASNQSNTASIIDKKVNPFLQTSNISGRIIEDEESIALKIQQENEGSYGYWLGVFFFVFILFLIGIYGLNK